MAANTYSSRASNTRAGQVGSVNESDREFTEHAMASARFRKVSDNTMDTNHKSVGALPQLRDSSDVLSRYFDFGHKDLRRRISSGMKKGSKPKLTFPAKQDAVKKILSKLQESSNNTYLDKGERVGGSSIIDLHE